MNIDDLKLTEKMIDISAKKTLPEATDQEKAWTAQLDRFFLNKYLGFPIMLTCFAILFLTSFTIGQPISAYLGNLLDLLAQAFGDSAAQNIIPPIFMSLISDGIFRGIGSALAFFPQMLIFFTFYTLITDTGYADRIAYLMHRPMARLKMAGRTFTPLILGYSCNVSAIISSRSITNKLDRLILMLISSFTPCSARFAVILYISAAFFNPITATLVMSGLIILSWIIKGILSYVIKTRFAAKESPEQRIELTPYHLPRASMVIRATVYRTLDFLNRIKNVVILSSVFIWFLSTFPLGSSFEASYAARIGQFMEPLGNTMGLNWQLIVALLFGFVAKETTLSTLGVLFHASEGLGNLSIILTQNITPLAGLTFLVVYMFYTPCVATATAIYKESNSFLFTTLAIVVSLVVAFILGILVYNLGRFVFPAF